LREMLEKAFHPRRFSNREIQNFAIEAYPFLAMVTSPDRAWQEPATPVHLIFAIGACKSYDGPRVLDAVVGIAAAAGKGK